jgi:serine/threonine-protein kinase HipA
LNIDTENNALDFALAKSVGEYFQLTDVEMNAIITEVKAAVSGWKKVARDIGISRAEQEFMSAAFRY